MKTMQFGASVWINEIDIISMNVRSTNTTNWFQCFAIKIILHSVESTHIHCWICVEIHLNSEYLCLNSSGYLCLAVFSLIKTKDKKKAVEFILFFVPILPFPSLCLSFFLKFTAAGLRAIVLTRKIEFVSPYVIWLFLNAVLNSAFRL